MTITLFMLGYTIAIFVGGIALGATVVVDLIEARRQRRRVPPIVNLTAALPIARVVHSTPACRRRPIPVIADEP